MNPRHPRDNQELPKAYDGCTCACHTIVDCKHAKDSPRCCYPPGEEPEMFDYGMQDDPC